MADTIFKVAHSVTAPWRLSRKTLQTVALALAYALFVVLFPWEEVSRGGFSDFDNYVEDFNYFSSQDVSKVESYQLTTLKDYIFSEVLWHELARSLAGLTGEAAIALRIISFFILFVWGLFLFRRVDHYGTALLFLFNPTAIDVAMSGIRNGLGWSLFMIGFGLRSNVLQAALFLTGALIHSTTLVLIAIYYLAKLATRVLKGRSVVFLGLGAGVLIGLAVTVGSQLVFGALGDRRTDEDYLVGGGSLLQASIWSVLLFLQCTSGREYVRQNVFVIAVLAWYLTMNPFIPWSFRVWGCLLPVIAAAALDLPARKRQLFMFLYAGYFVLQYLYWTKLFEYWYPA